MIDVLRFVVGVAGDVVRRRAGLVAENLLLRQQLIAAQRKIAGRVRWASWQRFTMGLAARMAPAWRDATLLVQPATILRWHRAGFRGFWRRRSRPSGRPPYGACGAHSRDGRTQSALGRGAPPRRAAQARHPRLQENRSAVHALREAPRRRAKLVDFPAESPRVGVRLGADLRRSLPRSLRSLLPRPWATADRPRRSDLRAERRVVRAASPKRHHGGCAGGLRLRPRREARPSLHPRARIIGDACCADRPRGA